MVFILESNAFPISLIGNLIMFLRTQSSSEANVESFTSMLHGDGYGNIYGYGDGKWNFKNFRVQVQQ